jgi:hypothetical protein
VYSEFKSFFSLQEAEEYLRTPRRNYMTFRKPESSFVGGKALRAKIDVWQDGHVDSLRVDCGLDTCSDVNLALPELLHDLESIQRADVGNCGSSTAFVREGTLKVLVDGAVLSVRALAATPTQLPRSCEVLLGIPGLDSLGVHVDQHRTKQNQPLMCHVGERTLREWWDANEGQAAPAIAVDIESVDVCPDLPAHIQADVRGLLRKY